MKTKRSVLILLAILSFMIRSWGETFQALVQNGALVSINTDVLNNPNSNRGSTVLMIHGMNHDGDNFRPLSQYLFAHPPGGQVVKRVLLLNMPGHGGSGLPYGCNNVTYSDLDLNDYAGVVIQSLLFYARRDMSPSVIVAHSMGGLVTQLAQEKLLNFGLNLNNLGIDKVNLIGSSSSGSLVDPFLEDGTGLYLLSLYTVQDPIKGPIASIDIPSWLNFFFTPDLNGSFVPGTPTPTIAARYYADESSGAASQTLGTQDMRPLVRDGVFAASRGTKLRVIVGAVDPFNSLDQQKALYLQLTGDQTYSGVRLINTPDSVHDQHISNPAAVAGKLNL